MAHRILSSDHSGTRALRRVARYYLGRAERCLAPPAITAAAVHDARKALRRSRTALRLLRPAMSRARYRRENAALRGAADTLDAARDTRVLVGTLAALRRSDRRLRDSPAVAELARRLHTEQSAARHRLQTHEVLNALRRGAQRCDRRVRRWPIGRHGWSVLGPALRRIYRTGRRAMPGVGAGDIALHEWRKHVKYLRYALQMLAPIRPGALRALARRAQALSDRLGAAHDLALLVQQMPANGGADPGGGADLQALLEVIERRRARLAWEALAAGGSLYRRRPRAFGRRLARAWRRWRGHRD